MTIYSQIATNRLKTYLIIGVFIALMTGFFILLGQYFSNPQAYLVIGLIISLASSIGSYFYADKIVLMTTGAKPADKKDYFDYYTVAENLSAADGLPMPKLYVINDPAPNAFATGRDPKHAAVAATTGLLHMMDRTELEGVLAHELSHVKNYDILVSTIVGVLVGTVALIADWIMRSLMWGGFRRNEKDERNPLMIVLFVFVLIITPIVATLIQLAVSRRREFLADASGALLTRYPMGLARALEKIAADQHQLRTATTSTAHLFIASPFKKGQTSAWITNLFSTHPPIEERIKILESM